MYKNTLLFFALILSFQICASDSNYSVSSLPSELLKNADAIVRNSTVEIDLSNKFSMKIKEFKAITVLNSDGERYLDFVEGYKQGTDKIKVQFIKYYDKFGKEIYSVSSKEIEDISSYDGFSLISDFRIKYYSNTKKSFPITIEYEFVKTTKNTLPPNWSPIPGFNTAVQSASYEIEGLEAEQLKFHESNFSEYGILNFDDLFYSASDLEAIKKEKYCPAPSQVLPVLYVQPINFRYEGYSGEFSNWNEMGKWFNDEFLIGQNNLDAALIRKKLDPIVQTESDPYKKAAIIYQYVQDNMRYVSISLDEGAIQPMKTKDVHEFKYGDCKALSFYTKALLESFGIKANYVEVYASSEKPFSFFPEFASMWQGNHVILSIPFEDDTAWIDCTSKNLPFNYLGGFSDNRNCLSISEEGGMIVKTPFYNQDINRSVAQIQIDLDSIGNAFTNIKLTDKGSFLRSSIPSLRYDEKEKKKYLKKRILGKLLEVKISDLEIDYNKAIGPEESFVETNIKLSSKNLASVSGDYLIMPLDIFEFRIPRFKNKQNRELNIQFHHSKAEEFIIELNCPEGFELAKELTNLNLSSDFADYYLNAERNENQIIITRKFTIKNSLISSERYLEVRGFFEEILMGERTQLIFRKK